MKKSGVTLIDVVVVLAAVGILAAVAAPKFNDASIRTKTAQAISDLQTYRVAAEIYFVDHGDYPRCTTSNWPVPYGPVGHLSYDFTTPIAYLSDLWLEDPFATEAYGVPSPEALYYNYHVFRQNPTLYGLNHVEAYGEYRFISYGPDKSYWGPAPGYPGYSWNNQHIIYDPTNGIISYGNIFVCQKACPLVEQVDINTLKAGM